MRSSVVTGAGGPLTTLVCERLAHLGPVRVHSGPATRSCCDGCDTLVMLGWDQGAPQPLSSGPALDQGLLSAAAAAGVTTVVHLSSAIVYGAWSDNAIPLTEDAALRPNPGLGDAVAHAEAERLLADWGDEHPEARVSVLRPAVVMGAGVSTWLARALSSRVPLRAHHLDPPRQFVHVEDLAGAVATAARERCEGVYNVAPDGWIGGEHARVLGGGGPTLAVPGRIAGSVAAASWKLHLSTLPPEVIPLVEQPWVIANDRLRGAGWAPSFTNEEAVVAGTPGNPWREMSPARRQEVALAVTAMAIVGSVAAATAAVRRRRG